MTDDRPLIQLVVNADDFGTDAAISQGILHAHRTGIVTSTSVIGNCADPAAEAVLLAQAPTLGVGAHLTMVAGAPVSDRARVPSLLDRTGNFPASIRDVVGAWARGLLRPDEIVIEFDAQVSRLRDAGLQIDHLDTHRHLGFLPPVGLALETVARRHGIAGIRSAVEGPHLGWFTSVRRGAVAATFAGLSWLTRRQMGTLRHGPQSWGYVENGRLDEIRILEILGRLGPGCHELICHPGDRDDHLRRQGELAALTAPIVKQAVARRGIILCRWADLF